MTAYDDDPTARRLALALAEEAARVEPSAGGLEAIQRRTAGRARRSGRSRWMLVTGGVAVATAGVVTAVVLLSSSGTPGGSPLADKSGGTGTPSTAVKQSTPPTPSPSARVQLTVHYVGPPRSNPLLPPYLYTESRTVESSRPADVAAVHEFLTASPRDPDYRTGWPTKHVDVTSIATSHGVTTIALEGTADLGTKPLPVPFDPSRTVAVQALLETAGIHGKARFTYNGHPLSLVLYTSASTRARPWSSLRAPVSIDNLVNGAVLADPVTVRVSGNTFEGNVGWQLLDDAGTKVAGGYVTASQGTWTSVPVRLGRLAAGTYTFRAFEPSAASGGPDLVDDDDKVFTVK
jgi:immunoglobulin-like protein involved in spore germination